MITISDELLRRLLVFRDERNWKQFHTPKNLASALMVEASELLECFQWTRDTELERVMTDEREHIEDELADVAIVFAYLCHDLKVDVDAVVRRKVHKNAMKYPVELARGSSKKYDKL